MRIFRVFCLLTLLWAVPAYPAVFNVASGDVPGLIAAINAANSNGQEDTINITGIYVLSSVNNTTDGPNGLPSITSSLTINGAGATIMRSAANGTPLFRVFHVAQSGLLTLENVLVAGGFLTAPVPGAMSSEEIGGGILSLGHLRIFNSAIMWNVAEDAGGIAQGTATGTFTMRDSIVSANGAANGRSIGGLSVCCRVSITNSTISEKSGTGVAIGGLGEHGEISTDIRSEIVDSSIFRNQGGGIGGVLTVGHVLIMNSTIGENTGGSGHLPAGVFLHTGLLSIVNATIANNANVSFEAATAGGILADPVKQWPH